jgi:hypothetical protein
MKEITIDGVTYLPAVSLAKQFRYTNDYIGQLCRAKKVDAQLVGRSWYVNPNSLTAHKNARYAGKVAKDYSVVSEKPTKTTVSRLDVQPVLTKTAVKTAAYGSSNFARRIGWQPLKYEVDEEALLPSMISEISPKRLSVDLADGVDIAINTSSKLVELEAEPLPTVALKGKVKVASLNEGFSLDSSDEDLEIPLEAVLPDLSAESPSAIYNSLPKLRENNQTKFVNQVFREKSSHPRPVVSRPMPAAVPVAAAVPILGAEEDSWQFIEISFVSTTGLLTIALLLLFFGEASVEATSSSYTQGLVFSTESLLALVSLFR